MSDLRLVVDNTKGELAKEAVLNIAVQAYWRAHEADKNSHNQDFAIEFLVPLRTPSPHGLAQKVQILENMVKAERSAELIAEFAASIADDALSMSRQYLSRAS